MLAVVAAPVAMLVMPAVIPVTFRVRFIMAMFSAGRGFWWVVRQSLPELIVSFGRHFNTLPDSGCCLREALLLKQGRHVFVALDVIFVVVKPVFESYTAFLNVVHVVRFLQLFCGVRAAADSA